MACFTILVIGPLQNQTDVIVSLICYVFKVFFNFLLLEVNNGCKRKQAETPTVLVNLSPVLAVMALALV